MSEMTAADALGRMVNEAARELERLARWYDHSPNARHEYRSGRQQVAENMAYYALGVGDMLGWPIDTDRLEAAESKLAHAQLGVTYES